MKNNRELSRKEIEYILACINRCDAEDNRMSHFANTNPITYGVDRSNLVYRLHRMVE